MAAEHEGLVGLGGGVDDDGAAAGEEGGQLVAQLLAELVVEVGERLVEEDEAGLLDDGAGERGALLLAAGELLRAAGEHGGEVEEVGGLAHAAVDLGPGQAGDAEGGGDVLGDGQVGVVHEELVHQADVALLRGEVGDVAAVEEDAPGGRLVEAGHELDQRGLAGAGLAEEHVEAVAGERQAGLVDVDVGADPLGDATDLKGHGRPVEWRERPPEDRRPRSSQLASAQRLTSSS